MRDIIRNIAIIVAGVILLICVLAPTVAFADTVTLTKGGVMKVSSSKEVPYYNLNGNIAYKSSFTAAEVAPGSYNMTYLNPSDDALLAMWFGYGGPGFDKSMWPATSYDGRAMSATDYAAATYVLVMSKYSNSYNQAVSGTEYAYQTWVSGNVVNGGLWTKAKARSYEVPENFRLVWVASGGASVISWDHTKITGGVIVSLVDRELGRSQPQGSGVFSGVSYKVVNTSDRYYVKVNGTYYGPGATILTLRSTYKSDLVGYGVSTDRATLPYGSYRIERVDDVVGYHKTSWARTFTIGKTGGELYTVFQNQVCDFSQHPALWDALMPIRGGVVAYVVDSSTGEAGHGDASFAGSVFVIRNISQNAVMVDGMMIGPGEIATTMTFTESGYQSRSDLLPYGAYQMVQVTAAPGYTSTNIKKTFYIRNDLAMVEVAVGDESYVNDIVRGGLELQVVDAHTMAKWAEGDGALVDSAFGIYNMSDHAIIVNGVEFPPDDEFPFLELHTDRSGHISVADDVLPYGTYMIRQLSAPEGYLVNAALARGIRFEIRYDGEIEDFETVEFADTNYTDPYTEGWHGSLGSESHTGHGYWGYDSQNWTWNELYCVVPKP